MSKKRESLSKCIANALLQSKHMKTSRKASPKIVMTTSPKKIKIQGQVTDEQVITVTTATKKLLTNIASKTHPTYRRSTSLGDEINHKLGHHETFSSPREIGHQLRGRVEMLEKKLAEAQMQFRGEIVEDNWKVSEKEVDNVVKNTEHVDSDVFDTRMCSQVSTVEIVNVKKPVLNIETMKPIIPNTTIKQSNNTTNTQGKKEDKMNISQPQQQLTSLERMVKRSSSAFFFQTSIVSQIDNVDPLRLYKHYLKMYYLKEIFQAKTWLLSTNSIEIVDEFQRKLVHPIIFHLTLSLHIFNSSLLHNQPNWENIMTRTVNLPRLECDINKKTLVIDLDETLVHCSEHRTQVDAIEIYLDDDEAADSVGGSSNHHNDQSTNVVKNHNKYNNNNNNNNNNQNNNQHDKPGRQLVKAYLSIRPYALTFLRRMKELYELVVFTASDQPYADVILDYIDPDRVLLPHRLYRESCISIVLAPGEHKPDIQESESCKIYTKDLRVINRPLNEIVLLDNAPYSYINQLENGVPILPYTGGEDDQLTRLERYLEMLAGVEDVRVRNREWFQLGRYVGEKDVAKVIDSLYFS